MGLLTEIKGFFQKGFSPKYILEVGRLMAKAFMVQGTGSGVGKSLLVAALCRIFNDLGVRVAPFKAQNMALNSFITCEGGEIGRAQSLQAEASRIEPSVHINPILLKVSGESGSQVIIHGVVQATMKAREYYHSKEITWQAVTSSYDQLSHKYDLIIMEGAGSPAEINLMDVDIVNMAAARYAKAPVLLIADIDKGGVFASIYGTIKLLGRDSRRIKGLVINKFRGDPGILQPGLEMIEAKTGKPVIGVLPYISDLLLPEEDGLVLRERSKYPGGLKSGQKIKIVIVCLKYISNFTDFDPLACEQDTEVIFSQNPGDFEQADLLIIPGTKNTVKDLLWLKETGLDESIRRALAKGIQVMGLCGGYQILGQKIEDPFGIESNQREINGLGLLNIKTIFGQKKITSQVEAKIINFPLMLNKKKELENLRAYEIHQGRSRVQTGLFQVRRLSSNSLSSTEAEGEAGGEELLDGAINGHCWGTYLHGIFENDAFRRGVINYLRKEKGLNPLEPTVNYSLIKDKAINNLANLVREYLDLDFIKRMINL